VARKFASIQSRAKSTLLTSDGSRPAKGHETVQAVPEMRRQTAFQALAQQPTPRSDDALAG